MWHVLTRLIHRIRAHDVDDRAAYVVSGTAVLFLAVLFVATMSAPILERVALTYTNVAAVVSAVLVELSNNGRAEASVPRLRENPVLTKAAQAKADDMAAKGYFAHFDAAGKTPWDWITEAGYAYKYAGENLAVQFTDSEDVVRAWLNSPTHRQNLLDSRFTEVGIALASGTYEGKPTVFVVQMFGTPLYTFAEAATAVEEPVAVAPAPESPLVVEDAEVAATEEVSEVLAQEDSGLTEESGLVLAEESSVVSPEAQVVVSPTEPIVTDMPRAIEASQEPASSKAVVAKEAPLPWWSRALASPWSTVRFLGALLLALFLAFTVYLVSAELRQGHLVHASAASVLYLAFGLLFIAADVVVFQTPAVPQEERVAFIENPDAALRFVYVSDVPHAHDMEQVEYESQAQVAAGAAVPVDLVGILTWVLVTKKMWALFVLLLLSAGSYLAWQRYRLGQS